MTKYYVVFNLMDASEGGKTTGHANVSLVATSDDQKLVSAITYGASSLNNGDVLTWTNPLSTQLDGYRGHEDPVLARFIRRADQVVV